MRRLPLFVVVAIAGWLLAVTEVCAEEPAFTLTIRNHQFDPSQLEVPAGAKVRLTLRNLDPTAEEFDSDDLHREKVVAGNSEGVVFIGPLRPGTYNFMGEYHQATAQGRIVAK